MKLVRNGKAATGLIFAFIALFCVLAWRCSSAATLDLQAGASFGPGRTGPVLGMIVHEPVGNAVDVFAGTLLWGETSVAPTNWDWHAGIRTCRWNLCASLGAAYVQDLDAVNGAHTNFFLGLTYLIDWHRLASIDFAHLSDAGSTPVNLGRDAMLLTWRLQ